jgi:hypothetical protein
MLSYEAVTKTLSDLLGLEAPKQWSFVGLRPSPSESITQILAITYPYPLS